MFYSKQMWSGSSRYTIVLYKAVTTQQVWEWLETKFQRRITSRYALIPLPNRSPDLSTLDYWFWSHCTERVTKVRP